MEGATVIGWLIDGDSRVCVYWRDGEYMAESRAVPISRIASWSESGHFDWVSNETREWFADVRAIQRNVVVPLAPTPHDAPQGTPMPRIAVFGLVLASVGVLLTCCASLSVVGAVLNSDVMQSQVYGSVGDAGAVLGLTGCAIFGFWFLTRDRY